MEIKDIVLNQAFSAAVDFQDGGSGNTVTYTIKKLSDGTTFASGNATWVVDGVWKVSFTPTTDGETYVLSVDNATLGAVRTFAFRATMSPQVVVAVTEDTTAAALLELVNEAIRKILVSGGVAMYTIGGRTVQRMSLDQLKKLRTELRQEVNASDSSQPQNSYATFEEF